MKLGNGWKPIGNAVLKKDQWYLVSGILYSVVAVRWNEKHNQFSDCMGYLFELKRFRFYKPIGDLPNAPVPRL